MIYENSKKWFLYSYLPSEVNKVFIYMKTERCVDCEKALHSMTEYFITRLDTIAKVIRVDPNESHIYEKYTGEGSYPTFPVVVFNGEVIQHRQSNVVRKIEEIIPDLESREDVKLKIKALKNGKDLL